MFFTTPPQCRGRRDAACFKSAAQLQRIPNGDRSTGGGHGTKPPRCCHPGVCDTRRLDAAATADLSVAAAAAAAGAVEHCTETIAVCIAFQQRVLQCRTHVVPSHR